MKTNTNNYVNFSMITMAFLLILLFIANISCTSQKADETVFAAYELRINGHADSAKAVLEEYTSNHPESAMAWYELCRTTQHLGWSNPGTIKDKIDEALGYINRAVENDPENTWYLSYKGNIETLRFYLALQTENDQALEYLADLEKTYQKVFQLDSSFFEDKLTLVEFYYGLPEDMGGNIEKATNYATELESEDLVTGAKARELLMPEDADYVDFWKGIIEKVPQSADAQQAMGRVYLFKGNLDEAKIHFQKAIQLDPSKNILYLDLGRYYMMMAMQNSSIIDSVAPLIEEQFNTYLNGTPEPNNSMKAWTYSKLAMIYKRTGSEEKANEFMKMAEEFDPFYSAAFGLPGQKLYSPPDVVMHEQGYYLSPF